MQNSMKKLSKINSLFLLIVTITLLLMNLFSPSLTRLTALSTISSDIAYFPYLFCLFVFVCLFAAKSLFELIEIIKIFAITLCFMSFYVLILNWVLSDLTLVNHNKLYVFYSALWGLAAFILLPFIQSYLVLDNFRFDYAKLAFFAWQNSITLILVLPIFLLLNLFMQIVLMLLGYFQLSFLDGLSSFRYILFLSCALSLSGWVVKFYKKQVDSLINIFYVIADSLLPIICVVVFAYGFYVVKELLSFSPITPVKVLGNINALVALGWLFLMASQSILSCDLKNNERLRSIFKHQLFIYAVCILFILTVYFTIQVIITPDEEVSEWRYWLLIQFACFSAYMTGYFIVALPFLKISLQQTFYYRLKYADAVGGFRFKRLYLQTWQRYHPKLNIEKINIYFALVFILLLIGLSIQITAIQNHVLSQATTKPQEDKEPVIPTEIKSSDLEKNSVNVAQEADVIPSMQDIFDYISPSVKLTADQMQQFQFDRNKNDISTCLKYVGKSIGKRKDLFKCGLFAVSLNREKPDEVVYIVTALLLNARYIDFSIIQWNETTQKYELRESVDFGIGYRELKSLFDLNDTEVAVFQAIEDKLQVQDAEVNTIQIGNMQFYFTLPDDK